MRPLGERPESKLQDDSEDHAEADASVRAREAFARGSRLYEAGEFARAANEFGIAIDSLPEWAEAWSNRAECLRSINASGRALRGFNRAIQLKPGLPVAHLGRGVVLRRLRKPEAAVRAIRRAVELDPAGWRGWTCLAEALHECGAPALAIAMAEKAVRVDESASDAHFTLGNLLLKGGEIERAKAAFKDAAEHDAEHAHARSNLAVCCFLSGDIEGALKAQIEALPVVRLTAAEIGLGGRQFDRQLARTALLTLREVLNGSGIEFFLAAGTLLGLVREGDFLEHDKDIDIGIFESVSPAKLEKALIASCRFELKSDFQPEKRYFTAYYQSLAIDFFRYASDGPSYVCGFNDDEGGVTWRFWPFPLAVRRFFGADFNVPDPPEQYLEEAFGDWRVPRRHFDPVQSSPARDRSLGESGALYLTLNKTFMAVIEGRYQLALEYLQQASVNSKFPEEATLLQERLSQKLANGGSGVGS